MNARRPALIDRDPQNLPIPLGGMSPVRMTRTPRPRVWRKHLPGLAAALGVCCAAAGVALALTPSRVAVYLSGDHVVVGGMELTRSAELPAGSGVVIYGGDASYVLSERGDGSATAASAWTSAGVTQTGICRMRPDGTRFIDECSFTSPAGHLTSIDLLDPARGTGWQRTYDDGTHVGIDVAPDGAAVPVAFPIGH